MRTVIYSMSVSLDGFIAGPDGDIGFTAPDEELMRFHVQQTRGIGAELMGRGLYEDMLVWEDAETTMSGAVELEFARIWKPIPKVVFSTTLEQVQGNARLASDDVAGEVARLREAPGEGVVSVGGAGLAATLIKLDLIDEYRLFVIPVVLGGGTPYFPPLDRRIELEPAGDPDVRLPGHLPSLPSLPPWMSPSSWPGSGPRAASSPRTKPGCSSPRPGPRTSFPPWSSAGRPACRWSRSWAGPSSAACGSPWIPASSSRAAAPSSWSSTLLLMRGPDRAAIVVDLCCGAGAIGAALAAAVDRAEVHAVDIDPAAVACARRNVPGHVYQGDLYQPLPARLRGQVQILAANVPYVPTGEIGFLPPEARAHEPLVALDGGPDGLDVLRRVAAGAPDWLAPGGHLLIETSERQAPVAAAAFAASGLTVQVATSADLNATVVIGTR